MVLGVGVGVVASFKIDFNYFYFLPSYPAVYLPIQLQLP